MSAFDSKIFNPTVFGAYVDRVPRTRMNKLLEAGVLRTRSEIKALFDAQSGGNFATVPMKGLIDGTPQNYDGATTVSPGTTKTYSQGMVVTGRMKGWIENDFSADITGEDFMDNVAAQVATYWEDVDQDTMLAILKGIFLMGANDFTTNHTYDITGETTKTVGATTLNSALQKASGANKDIFKVVICHSVVATNLENVSAVSYLTYTAEDGTQRDLGMATWNGRLLLIDDSVPAVTISSGSGTDGVYTLTVSGAGAVGDAISFDGIEYTCTDDGAGTNEFADGDIASVCTALQALLAVQYATTFTVTKTGTTVVFTQKTAGYGTIPSVVVTQYPSTGTLAANIVETTPGVAATSTINYTSYALGEGAFDYCDCGAKVPNEMFRDPKTNGGQDTLITRQRKLFAPYGINFTKSNMASNSPTTAELELGANWSLVQDSSSTYNIDHKAIPIARIVSRG